MSVLLDVHRILEHTLRIEPDTSLTVNEVLDELQSHFKGQRNEALRRRELLRCSQTDGESFSDYYVRLKNLAEEVDLCSGNPVTCAEIQLKMILFMGVREEELVHRLISLDTDASLQDVVTCCRSFETTQTAAFANHSSPSQLCVLSSYKDKCHDKTTHSPQQASSAHREKTSDGNSTSAYPCQFCAQRHGSGKCTAADGTCHNCGGKGHWAKTDKCPAKKAICRFCKNAGHYDKHCQSKRTDNDGAFFHPKRNFNNCRCVNDSLSSNSEIPKPVCVHLVYGENTSRLQMLPDTGADVTVIGKRHLEVLSIPCSSLQLLPSTTTLTADGSEIAPALGYFQATIRLRKKSCVAKTQVHDGVARCWQSSHPSSRSHCWR